MVAVPDRSWFDNFVGEWTGAETLHPSPWTAGGSAEGKWSIRRDGAGLHLVFDYAEQRADGGRFDAHGVLARDPENGDVLLFIFDSFGFPPLSPARGRWEGSRLVLDKATPRGVGRTVFMLEADGFGYAVSSRLPTRALSLRS